MSIYIIDNIFLLTTQIIYHIHSLSSISNNLVLKSKRAFFSFHKILHLHQIKFKTTNLNCNYGKMLFCSRSGSN